MRASIRIYNLCLNLLSETHYINSPNQPLWHNPHLPYFLLVGLLWAWRGLKYVHQLYEQGVFKFYVKLQQELGIPNSWQYRYFQLRHATKAQLGLREVHLYNSKFPQNMGAWFSCLSSSFFKLQDKRLTDVPDLTPGNWQEACNFFVDTVISARDKFFQLRYIHRVYYTPK